MNKNTKARLTTVVAGTAILALFGGGSAVAGSLVTSAKIKDNTVRSVDVLNGGLRGVDIKDGSLRGADVADGTVRGADIADGSLSNADISVYNASVLANGTKEAASPGTTTSKVGVGSYVVNFGRPVAACSATATVGSATAALEVHGEADVTSQLFNNNAVHVYTRTAGTNTNADLPFMVTLVC